ncbi:MAG TPA: hypothetical protein PKC39_03040 [Ferruginibacter sp.]|nr:hypothetical protein [Ferruginibacter sp.]HMP19913.1 hypothetical protein [Ferruginibacter sp.]
MSKAKNAITKPNKRLLVFVLCIVLILLVPFTAMQFTQEVKWTAFDFIAAGVLMLGTGLLLEFILRKVQSTRLKAAACIILIVLFLLIWIELAVGIFGTAWAGS